MSKFSTGLLLGRIEANRARQEAEAQAQYIRRLELEKERDKAQISELVIQNRQLRARIAGFIEVRNRLREALKEVAPNHEYTQVPCPSLEKLADKAIEEEWNKG